MFKTSRKACECLEQEKIFVEKREHRKQASASWWDASHSF